MVPAKEDQQHQTLAKNEEQNEKRMIIIFIIKGNEEGSGDTDRGGERRR